MTSNLFASEYKIIVDRQNLTSGSLPVKSAVRVDNPFSVLQSKILKIQAKLNTLKLKEVKKKISKLIQ